jgi:hypothetical protein
MEEETVWLKRQQIATLFDRDIKTISKHINNALSQELRGLPTVAKFATVQQEGDRLVNRDIEYFNLDMILSVGYRVKSQKGILIDNYIDDSVLLMLAKRADGVTAEIVTRRITETQSLDIERHNRQYPPVTVRENDRFHDRFLIIDDTVYHLGASLKDLGKKLFAFSKMEIGAEVLFV